MHHTSPKLRHWELDHASNIFKAISHHTYIDPRNQPNISYVSYMECLSLSVWAIILQRRRYFSVRTSVWCHVANGCTKFIGHTGRGILELALERRRLYGIPLKPLHLPEHVLASRRAPEDACSPRTTHSYQNAVGAGIGQYITTYINLLVKSCHTPLFFPKLWPRRFLTVNIIKPYQFIRRNQKYFNLRQSPSTFDWIKPIISSVGNRAKAAKAGIWWE